MAMRQIKFRAIELDTMNWRYGSYVKEDGFWISEGEPDYSHPITDHYICENGKYFDVAVETVGEFTGKTDKQGYEVYEGDIYWNGDKDYQPMIVFFDNSTSSFAIKSKCGKDIDDIEAINFSSYRLIGNIHEHTHLLEK